MRNNSDKNVELEHVTGAYSGLLSQYWTSAMFSYAVPVHMLGGISAYSIILFEQESGRSNMGKTVQTEFCICSCELMHWCTLIIPLGITPILVYTIVAHVFLSTMV